MAHGKASSGYAKEKTRRGYCTIPAKDPHDGGTWDVLISDEKLDFVAKKQGMGAAKELAYVVRPSLLVPRAIYRGVRDRREGDDWMCYTALPVFAFNFRTHEQVLAWPNEVLLMFVTDERVLYNWSWYAADPSEPYLPVDHVARFVERLYLDKKGCDDGARH